MTTAATDIGKLHICEIQLLSFAYMCTFVQSNDVEHGKQSEWMNRTSQKIKQRLPHYNLITTNKKERKEKRMLL